MMGASLIRSISDHAAYRAAQEDKHPLFIEHEGDVPHIPFLGSYVPVGWRQATWADMPSRPRNARYDEDDENATFMVDASGWGSDNEPALTREQLTDYIKTVPGFGWGFIEQGQFQIVVAAYIKDDDAPGVAAPEPDPCEDCGDIHDDLTECDPYELESYQAEREENRAYDQSVDDRLTDQIDAAMRALPENLQSILGEVQH